MKRMVRLFLGSCLAIVSAVAYAMPTEKPAELSTDQAKLSYALGIDFGHQLSRRGVALDPENFARGLADSQGRGNALLTNEEMAQVLANFQKMMVSRQQEEFRQLAQDNARAGHEFQISNSKKSGVIVLGNGLQYRILKKGKGAKPSASDAVTVHYSGKFVDGQLFDSSYKTGKPITFALADVISGWSQVLQMMPVGSEWEVVIPPDLAYGEAGLGSPIGPNQTLVFHIELLSLAPSKKA